MTKSLLLSNVDDGRRLSSQTRMHDVSRQVSNSENGESGDFLVSITHLELTFICMKWAFALFVFECYHLAALMFIFLRRSAAQMYPGTFEMMKSLLLSNVDDGRCFSSPTIIHDVYRQMSNSANGESGDCLV
jgi:hypothetical protein